MPLGKVGDIELGEMCDVLEKLEAPGGPAETLVEMLGAHHAATASAGSYIQLP